MKKGGIQIRQEFRQQFVNNNLGNIKLKAFQVFLYHSRCEILTYKSRGGIIFKLILNDGVESPYVLTRSNNPYSEVREIILKFVFINDKRTFKINITDDEDDSDESDESYDSDESDESDDERPGTDLNKTSEKEFINEVNIQIDIFERTLDQFLEPICPGIPFCSIYDHKYFEIFINFLLNNCDSKTKNILTKIKTNKYLNKFKIGVIAMECLTGFQTLSSYLDTIPSSEQDKIRITESMARFEIARLYELGYIHGDLNQGNLLIHPTYQYFDGRPGRVMLIDFGSTFKPMDLVLPPINADNSNLYVASEQSSIITSPVYDEEGRIDYGLRSLAYTHLAFRWVTVSRTLFRQQRIEEENTRLRELFQARERLKAKFSSHVEGNVVVLQVPNNNKDTDDNQEFEGGVNPPPSLDEFMKSQKEDNKSLPEKTEYSEKDSIDEKNIFSILDPEKKFTEEYIKNYIDTEKEHNLDILENVDKKIIPLFLETLENTEKQEISEKSKNKKRGGKYKTKKYYTRKYKTRKYKNKRRNTRRKNKVVSRKR